MKLNLVKFFLEDKINSYFVKEIVRQAWREDDLCEAVSLILLFKLSKTL